jgi:hypothetical protein
MGETWGMIRVEDHRRGAVYALIVDDNGWIVEAAPIARRTWLKKPGRRAWCVLEACGCTVTWFPDEQLPP